MTSKSIVVVSDWDADGVVSAAEIVYAQEYIGRYPINSRQRVTLIPSSARSIESTLIDEVQNLKPSILVVLDIPYTRGLENILSKLKKQSVERLIYVDHHLSTLANSSKLERVIDEFVVGKAPTALLVAHILKSHGVKLSIRLDAFVKAASIAERGYAKSTEDLRRWRKLVSIVVEVSKALAISKNRELWEKLVRWLASPTALTAMPFTPDIKSMLKPYTSRIEDLKSIALELAPTAQRVFNLRVIDVRNIASKKKIKSTALASILCRMLRTPIAIVTITRDGKTLLIIRSRDDTPYRLATKMMYLEDVESIGGHQSLALIKFKTNLELNKIIDHLRKALLTG